MGLFEDIGNSISNVTQEAKQWMRDRADDARDTISGGYSRIMHEAVGKLEEKSPDALKGVVAAVGHGYADIGTKVVDFLDPVSYALETGADLVDMATESPGRRIDAIKRIARGDVGEGFSALGKEYLDETLLKAQVAAAVIPGGTVAGKAAKKPLKAARKTLKQELKATTKGSEARKAVKTDLRINKLKSRIGVPFAKTSGIVAKQETKARIQDAREGLSIKNRRLHVSSRDWESFARETDFLEPLNRKVEEGHKWTKQKQKQR